jgi:hypothetical protein
MEVGAVPESLLPACGEKLRMRGWASTRCASPRKRGEGSPELWTHSARSTTERRKNCLQHSVETPVDVFVDEPHDMVTLCAQKLRRKRGEGTLFSYRLGRSSPFSRAHSIAVS